MPRIVGARLRVSILKNGILRQVQLADRKRNKLIGNSFVFM
jgi:hypothetical protein